MLTGRIAIIVASFNRKNQTLRFIDSLLASLALDKFSAHIILVDDNSQDGTRQAVAFAHPEIEIIRGDGTWYWAGSVRRGTDALSTHLDEFDGILLANDDVALEPHAVGEVYRVAHEGNGIAAGAVYTANGMLEATGGLFGCICRPSQRLLEPSGAVQRCDLLPAHCMYIPTSIFRALGSFSPDFTHGYMDLEYSLRAGHAGVPLLLAPTIVGHVDEVNSYQDATRALDLSLRQLSWRLHHHPKSPPLREGVRYLKLVSPWAWPLWIIPYYRGYFRAASRSVGHRFRRRVRTNRAGPVQRTSR